MANNIIRRYWKEHTIVNIDDLGGTLFQAEELAHTFEIHGISDSGSAVALSGTVAAVFLRPDKTDVAISGSVSDGVVSVTLTSQCYDVPGKFGLTVYLISGGQKVAIYAAVGNVGRTSSGVVTSGTVSDVVDLIDQISTAVATIPASYTDLMAAVAPTYSTSAVYAIGSYAWYSGKLYKCTIAITSGETWTSGHWTLANLGSDVSDLKSAFVDLSKCGILTGKALNTSTGDITSATNYAVTNEYIPVKAGTVVKKGSLKGYIALYSGRNVSDLISVGQSSTSTDETIASDCFMRICIRHSSTSTPTTVDDVVGNITISVPGLDATSFEQKNNIIDSESVREFCARDTTTGVFGGSPRYNITRKIPVDSKRIYYLDIEHVQSEEEGVSIFAFDENGDFVAPHSGKMYYSSFALSSAVDTTKMYIFPNTIKEIEIQYGNECDTVSLLTIDRLDAINAQKIEKDEESFWIKETNPNKWIPATIGISTGQVGASNSYAILQDEIPENVLFVKAIRTKNVVLYAYTESEYKGIWDGSAFQTSNRYRFTYLDMKQMRAMFPGYHFYIWINCKPNEVGAAVTYAYDPTASEDNSIITNDPFGAMIKIAESYFNVAYASDDVIEYEENYGVFANNPKHDDVKKITCSQFVAAVLEGIYYDASRYKKDNNLMAKWKWQSDGTGTYAYQINENYIESDYMFSQYLCKYFDEHGNLTEYNEDHNDLQKGDIMFFGNSEVYPDRYKHIGHCAFVLDTKSGNYPFFVFESAHKTRTFDNADVGLGFASYSVGGDYRTRYYAKNPLPPINITHDLILDAYDFQKERSISAGQTGTIGIIANKIKQGFYTASIHHSKEYDDKFYTIIKITYANGEAKSFYGRPSAGKDTITFYVEQDDATVEIQARNNYSSSQGITIYNVKLYTGGIAYIE